MVVRGKSILKLALGKTSLPELLIRRRARRKLTVLTYHRVLDSTCGLPVFDHGNISASPEDFRRQVKYCIRNFDIVSINDIQLALDGVAKLPDRPLLLTFDDGYIDNYEIVFPILKDAGVSGTFFLATDFVGSQRMPWWDRVACCLANSRDKAVTATFRKTDRPYLLDDSHLNSSIKRYLRNLKQSAYDRGWYSVQQELLALEDRTGVKPDSHIQAPLFVNWEQVREMQRAGMHLGGHTRSHPILAALPTETELRYEIAGCSDDAVVNGLMRPAAFAYPTGSAESMSSRADQIISEAGFKLSFALNHSSTCVAPLRRFRISRLMTSSDATFDDFRLMLATNHDEPAQTPLPSELCPSHDGSLGAYINDTEQPEGLDRA